MSQLGFYESGEKAGNQGSAVKRDWLNGHKNAREYFERDLLPTAIMCGVSSVDAFWHLTLRQYEAYVKAYEMKRKDMDSLHWLNGMYTISAIGFAASKIVEGNKSKAEYTSRPLLSQEEEIRQESLSQESDTDEVEVLSEEERKRKAEAFFTTLHIFSANVRLNNLRAKLAKEAEEKTNNG